MSRIFGHVALEVNEVLDIDAFRTGDRMAFARLYKDNIHHLIRYGYKITSNRNLIQDCTQDLFVELWENREHLGDIRSLRFYLLK